MFWRPVRNERILYRLVKLESFAVLQQPSGVICGDEEWHQYIPQS
jgi:hypothetical protein